LQHPLTVTTHSTISNFIGSSDTRTTLRTISAKLIILWDLNAEEKDWLESDTDDEIVLDINRKTKNYVYSILLKLYYCELGRVIVGWRN